MLGLKLNDVSKIGLRRRIYNGCALHMFKIKIRLTQIAVDQHNDYRHRDAISHKAIAMLS